MVVLYHYNASGAGFGPLAPLVLRGYQAIDLLFVLSGHVMALAHGRRLRTGHGGVAGRVYPLYLAVTLTCLALAPAGWSRMAVLAFIAGQDAAVLHPVLAGEVPRRGPLDVFGAATPLPLLRCIAGCTLGLAAFRLAVVALDTRAVLPHEAACRPGGHSWESS